MHDPHDTDTDDDAALDFAMMGDYGGKPIAPEPEQDRIAVLTDREVVAALYRAEWCVQQGILPKNP